MTLLRGVRRGSQRVSVVTVLLAFGLTAIPFVSPARAQDQDDPPGRVARLGYMEGSVSFQPAGEDEWVEAVHNRPMTTGDKLWADRDSRAEVQLGSATIDLGSNTGFSLLNLDDRTTQIQLSAGALNVRVWDLDRDNVFEIDTPNLAFTLERPGRYRVEASENGDYTVVTLREGEGEATGNGQSYTMHSGQRFTFRGTGNLNAEVEQIGPPDDFDRWADARERRYEDSPSARYCSRRVVGYSDLDEYGEWQPTPDYGYVWFPRVDPGWAPYHTGHWAWIDPWGWTWVDDAPWGYAPFHYGRWSYWRGRWGWVPGPREERPVYAPALVAFVGGGVVAGATVAWFPLGPREVYVPSYRVSERYVNRVNITNTTVNTTVIHNVYNTTIINNNTTINNVTYANRNVRGAVVAVPQRAFVSAQPVARNTVAVDTSKMRATPVMARAAVPPGRESVMGMHANTAGRVAAPPQAVASRAVIAKAAPPPPPPSFAARQQVLAQHPGQPIPRAELQRMAPARPPATAPVVRQAGPSRPATPQPAMNRPGNQPQPGNPGANARPGNPAGQPAPAPGANNRPFTPPGRNERPEGAQPNNRPAPNEPNNRPQPEQPNNRPSPNEPNNRPQPSAARPAQPEPGVNNRPFTPPGRNDRPPSAQPNYRPEMNPPAPNNRPQPTPPPARNERPETAQPNYRPEPNRPEPNRAEPNVPRANQPMPDARPMPSPRSEPTPDARPTPPRAEPNRPPAAQPQYQPPPRAQAPPPQERPQSRPTPEARPAPPAQRESRPAPPPQQQSHPAPQQKNRQDENKKPQ
jgi:hypothetical protein